uniref:Dedicator of cytokinesis protein 9-like n=1 Tax=Saccoglossus kowalevskii TaxID=10224 RepID=A0ABM0MV96_SACKO|nr:PREDICTED: dedicator of cytokinesis protein 9-like [Saccoglossus kowalevskii]
MHACNCRCSGTPSISTPRLMDNRSSKSGSSVSLISGNSTVERSSSEKVAPNGHSRTPSTSGNIFFSYDKLEESEVKDLLVCLLYILKNLNEEIILGWWNQSTEKEQIEFFQILEICLYQFRYQGKKLIAAISLAEGDKSKTLPPRIVRPHTYAGRSLSMATDIAAQLVSSSDADSVYRSLLEANMATEVGITVLDIICLYCLQFKHQLEEDDGDNILMRKVFDIFLSYLQMSQSEVLLKHVFAGLRTFISKFPTALFKGHAHLCGDLCYEILRCCNSKLSSTRNEACALLYLLMRNNFEYTGRREFVRVHIQVSGYQ